MTHIGIKIKELRKKKDMTQEKLAEYLNVSFQAVSKWETGSASPDLSMIVPLARFLDVTTDELFGLVSNIDERQEELLKMWQETWHTGDTEKRYEVSKTAVSEYPGNFDYLMWLADAEADYVIHNCEKYSDEQKAHFQNAIKYYEMIIEDCTDENVKNNAIYGIVMNLPNIGRREDAIPYAKQHPNSDEMLMWCLVGEEREKCRQKLILGCMNRLVGWLEWGKHDLPSIKAAENIVKTIISDGNYLYHNDTLMHNKIWQAMCLTREKRFDEAISVLKESYEYAAAYERVLKNAKDSIPYTCPVLNLLEFDVNDLSVSGTTALTEDFKEYRKLGMSEEQIQIMYEFDLELFNSERRYCEHTQSFIPTDFDENEDDEEKLSLFEKFKDVLTTSIEDEENKSRYWWIEEIDDPHIFEAIKTLSENDLEILTQMVMDERKHEDIAQVMGISVRTVERKRAYFRKIFKKI